MRRLTVMMLILALCGCADSRFKMPKEDYRQQVKTLGVLPLLVDEGSTVLHPRREEVFALLERHNQGKQQWLVEMLRERKAYFDVREGGGEPQTTYRRLVAASSVEGDGAARHRRYRFNSSAVAELCRRNAVDALLVVIHNGIVRNEKRWDRDRTSLNYLQADYNSVAASAAVVLADGRVVWEYAGGAGDGFLDLQYPDFDEAYYNATDQVRLHFVTIDGLERILTRRDSSLLFKSSLSQRYKALFEAIADGLEPGLLNRLRGGQSS